MSEMKINEMKWNEIPAETPVYEVLQSIGFPEPMIILKHLNKPHKSGKKPDLSGIVNLFWMPIGDIQELLEDLYKSATRNTEVRQYLINHPSQAILLAKTYKQLQEEPLSVVAERNLNQWRTLLIEDGVWENLMKETPLTIIERIMKMFSDTDYLNMSLGEYYEKFGAEEIFEKFSIKAIGDKFTAAEERERQMKQLEKELKAAGLGDFETMLKMAMMSRHPGYPGRSPFSDNSEDSDKFTS